VVKGSIKLQNWFLLTASYVFYGWWDWRFLSLIAFSSTVDYFIGITLGQTEQQRKRHLLLVCSLVINLGLLAWFKYFNFFAESFAEAFTILGSPIDISRLNIILPVGISFYTFQTLSYTIDVYRKEIEPTQDASAFFAFVSFFPQLVAGPIERASNLLPQFLRKREFSYSQAVDGSRQILWGLIKKVVIADNCAEYVNVIFADPGDYTGSTLLLGAIFFAFQIYGDFSGYSDIAIGTARLFGFNLMKNFAFPYFSRDIAEFWRRWHISLSSWFKDYLYIPLGGSKGGMSKTVRNTFLIFGISGLWHGANWTFIVWGLLNALYFMPLLLGGRNRKNLGKVAEGRNWPTAYELFSMGKTFAATVLAWVFFRADSVSEAFIYLKQLFTASLFTLPEIRPKDVVVFLVCFVLIEWIGRDQEYAIGRIGFSWPKPMRWAFYYGLVLLVIVAAGQEQEFIYFQF